MLRRLALGVGVLALGGLGWAAWRVVRAQTSGPNLHDNLHLLFVGSLLAVCVTVAGVKGAVPLAEPRISRRAGRPPPPKPLLLLPEGGLPRTLDLPVLLLGSNPSAHVVMPDAPEDAARIERREGRAVFVPSVDGWTLDGEAVTAPVALQANHVLVHGSWTATVREA